MTKHDWMEVESILINQTKMLSRVIAYSLKRPPWRYWPGGSEPY
jgi:hypothetical protein